MLEEFRKELAGLGIKIKDPQILQTAFTHRSYLNESKTVKESNERLEFLGDSVLSEIVSLFLFHSRLKDEEGDLTNLRAYIVKTNSLAKTSQKLGLGKFLRLSKGEELSGGRENPQLLANTYEAVLGAIFLDQGRKVAERFVHLTLLPMFSREIEEGAPHDFKSQLQEVAQSKLQTAPKYRILSTSGPDHAKKFVVGVFLSGKQMGEGSGSNKQEAEEEAAKLALVKLDSESLT